VDSDREWNIGNIGLIVFGFTARASIAGVCFGYYIYQRFASNGVWNLKSFLGPYLPLAVLMRRRSGNP